MSSEDDPLKIRREERIDLEQDLSEEYKNEKLHPGWVVVGVIIFIALAGVFIPLVVLGFFHDPEFKVAGVASSNYYASQVGIQVLRDGGNAFDAAVAMQAVLTVTEPFASGIGGFSNIIGYDSKDRKIFHLDGNCEKPSNTNQSSPNSYGGSAVSVPGTMAALARLVETHGTWTLEKCLEPAIKIAEEGWIVTQYAADQIAKGASRLKLFPSSTAIYFRDDNTPKQEGDIIKNPDLAETFRIIAARGVHAFYTGDIAESIIKDTTTEVGIFPGNITHEDLQLYEAVFRPPLSVQFMGEYEIWSSVTPSSTILYSGIGIDLLTQIMDSTIPQWGDPKILKDILNIMSLASVDSETYGGDYDWIEVTPPWETLLSEPYAIRRSKLINQTSAIVNAPPGLTTWPSTHSYHRPHETQHFSIMDKDGNTVSCTSSLGAFWGNGQVVTGRGFFLNNVNYGGEKVVPLPRGRVKRKTALPPYQNSMGAYRGMGTLGNHIVLKHGQPFLACGTPGDQWIPGNTFTTMINILYFGMGLEEAILKPRYSSFNKGTWYFEEGLFNDTKLMNDLEKMGVNITELNSLNLSEIGDVNAVMKTNETVQAFADPRRNGTAFVT